MIEYLQLMYFCKDRGITGMETYWEYTIEVKDDMIVCKNSGYSRGIRPVHAFEDSSHSKEGIYKGDINVFLEKLENTGFRKWDHEFDFAFMEEGDYYNLNYKDKGQDMITIGGIENIEEVEQMELLLLSVFD